MNHWGQEKSHFLRPQQSDSGEAIISDDTQMTLFTAEGILLADDPYVYKDFINGVFEYFTKSSW